MVLNLFFWSLRITNRKHSKCLKHKYAEVPIPSLTTRSLCGRAEHGSQQSAAAPTPLIYRVNFSNSPCSPCWPDNPCRQLQTNHTDSNGNGSWGSAQCVSGYDTPVNQVEMPQHVSQRAVVLVLLPKGASDVISLSILQPTFQITDTTSLFLLLLSDIYITNHYISQTHSVIRKTVTHECSYLCFHLICSVFIQ